MPVTGEVAKSSIGPRSHSENQWTHQRRRCRLAQHTQTMFRLPVPHGMSKDRDFLHLRVLGEILEEQLQGIARVVGTLPIVAIREQTSPGRPCDQHRRACYARIVNDLGKAIDRVFEPIVEAVNEDQHTTVPAPLDGSTQPFSGIISADFLRLQSRKVRGWIGWESFRPCHLTNFAHICRWDGDGDFGKGRVPGSFTGKHFAVDHRATACGGD